MKHTDSITKLNLEQKCALLSGDTVFTTRGYKNAGVPSITLSDGPNGVRKQAGAADHLGLNPSVPATCFPTAATVACSWDPALGEEIGRAMGEEAAAQKVAVLLGPGLNTKRSPLCGRNFEYFSEDPYLSGKMAAAYVRGIQSEGISACPKHFAVNSQELRRMASDSVVDERTLRELYLTGFEIVVKEAHPKALMSSYNLINGIYANENAHLLQDILREEWGFDGAVVTDWGGSNDHALGVKNGSTLEMPAPGGDAVRELLAAVRSGKIAEADVDARLDELLTLVLDTHAAVERHSRSFDADAHHALARRAAGESVVLLKNDDALLPLAEGTRVAVIGDFAETPRYQGAGSSAVNSIKVDTFLDCLNDSGLHSVGFAPGFDRQGKPDAAKQAEAVALAAEADAVLLCLGLDEIKESEGLDRADMKLADNQIELLQAVREANPNTVVIVNAGASLETPWLAHCKALVYGALGGQAGAGAMVDVLTGKINPGGKLAETWANAYADTPARDHFAGPGRTVGGDESHKMQGKTVVIGGGNVAIDAARVALRCGSDDVTMVCLEPREKMPASVEEIAEAEEEGTKITCGYGPKEFIAENGHVTAVVLKKCTGLYNAEGRFAPTYDENDTITLPCENVVLSIGQCIEWGDLLNGEAVELGRGQGAVADALTYQTAQPDVFVGGDVYTGPRFAIDAIAAGKQGAISIHRYVQPNTSMTIGRNRRDFHELDKNNLSLGEYDHAPRQTAALDESIDTHRSFRDAHLTLTEDQVKIETARCLGCGASVVDPNKCIGCGVCTTKCEFDAIHLHRDLPECSKMVKSEDKFKAILPYMAKREIKIRFSKKEK